MPGKLSVCELWVVMFHTIRSPSITKFIGDEPVLGNLVSHFLFTFQACEHFEILLDTWCEQQLELTIHGMISAEP